VALARIGVGANLGDARAAVEAAIAALPALGTVISRSSLYASAPWGVRDQPPFVNAAVLLETILAPRDLLAGLQELERSLGRTPTYRWGPRAIDLDILAYDGLRIDEADLVVPHPRLGERAFALVPLAEIDPAYGSALARLTPEQRAEVALLEGVNAYDPCALANDGDGAVHWDEVVQRVREVAAVCRSGDLARLQVSDGDVTIEVRRTPGAAVTPQAAALAATVAEEAHAGNGVASPGAETVLLRSDVVGIVRLARPALGEGAALSEGRELAYIESLGIRNPVTASRGGHVVRVLVRDGEPVEFGQPLFEIER
jgi:2-amino-4-hydroxy-6-hydroxymethyldihydropteridine diphosphokinase